MRSFFIKCSSLSMIALWCIQQTKTIYQIVLVFCISSHNYLKNQFNNFPCLTVSQCYCSRGLPILKTLDIQHWLVYFNFISQLCVIYLHALILFPNRPKMHCPEYGSHVSTSFYMETISREKKNRALCMKGIQLNLGADKYDANVYINQVSPDFSVMYICIYSF